MQQYLKPAVTFLLSLLCWIMFCVDAFAQQSLIRTYTVGDGLVMNRVRGFHQDNDGFIWIYTWDGLSRYEGYRFRNYRARKQLRHSFVNDILTVPNGTTYLPLNDSSLAVMHNLEVDTQVLFPGDVINNFCSDDQGRIYAGTDHSGICLFEDGKLRTLSSTQSVKSILQVIWYQDHFFFIGPYSGPSGVYDHALHLVASWEGPPAYFNSIYQDSHDQIYVCTQSGLKQVDLESPMMALTDPMIIPQDAPWKDWDVTSIVITPEDDAWIGTSNGLVHLRADKSWSILTVADGLLSNHVSTLFLDHSNILWIGTDAGAASINLQTKIVNNRDLPGIVSNYVLNGQDGNVYVISGYAFLNEVNSQMQIIRSVPIEDVKNSPQALIPNTEGLLLMRQSSIENVSQVLFPFHETGPVQPGVVYVRQNGRFWIATDAGFQCSNGTGDSHPMTDSTFDATCIALTKKNQILIGTLQNGVILATSEEHATDCTLRQLRNLSPWIDDPRIRSLMVSKTGDIWIGTRYGGIVRLQCKDDFSDCVKQTFTIDDGLISNWITSFLEDKFGNIWVGSASGIDKLIPRGDDYFIFPFSRINAYYANVRNMVTGSDGSLWIGHNEGLAHILDGRIDTIGPAKTFITEVTLGGAEFDPSNALPARLHYDQNSAHFAFSTPDYINTQQLNFTYRLVGSKDDKWSHPVRTHEIFYGNLSPGKFKFEVAAFGWNGEQGVPVSYAFEILKPFWKQTWFIILWILVICGSVYGLYRFRIAQMQRVQAVRDRIAADLHDEIGSSLTHINILSEIGKKEQPIKNGTSGLFERIGAEVQTSAEALDDIIWSVRTKRDAIGDVIARMRQYATEIFEPEGIFFQLHEEIVGEQTLEMEFKRDFYLIYKELLRNVLKHAGATVVEIHIKGNSARVSIHIKDNGKGFDTTVPSERSGLSNIRSRVQKWNGSADWTSLPGGGTDVKIEMRPG